MRLIQPQPVPPFVDVEAELAGCIGAVATTFYIGRHVYSLRFECYPEEVISWRGVTAFHGIAGDGLLHVVKFDNAINAIDGSRAYAPMEPAMRLSVPQIFALTDHLAGGIDRYISERAPKTIIGVPNSAKLQRWYRHLVARTQVSAHLLSMVPTAYHTYDMLLIHRQ
ncbi:hypothetical protein STVA_11130 [Allostella vacuolata]|nr:hypothetical protein STVA_11130 [Stella vacuolata]